MTDIILSTQNGEPVVSSRQIAESFGKRHDHVIRDTRRSDYNSPTQRAMELGLFEVKETSVVHSDGHVSISRTPKVTGKGQIYFVNRFLGSAPAAERS